MKDSNSDNNNKHEYGKPVNREDWSTPKQFKILYTDEVVDKKPETMTHLYENVLVYKDEPRIVLRGKLDSLQAKIIETQAAFAFDKANERLIAELKEILDYSRQILGNEVLNKPMDENVLLLGLDEKQIRDISHNPMKYFDMKQMVLIEYSDGIVVAKLNLLRTLVREAEIEALKAFRKGDSFERSDIVMALNRLSSIFHILIYREMAGEIKKQI